MQPCTSECLHYDMCGSASMYNDASTCEYFKSAVEYKELSNYKTMHENAVDSLEEKRAVIRDLNIKIEILEKQYERIKIEYDKLQVMKRTVEVMCGEKFD